MKITYLYWRQQLPRTTSTWPLVHLALRVRTSHWLVDHGVEETAEGVVGHPVLPYLPYRMKRLSRSGVASHSE
jgi:hypothetical protein